ncbi:hypothetical protein I4U23_006549 [Adineta vaga]|nr:hypothetical protein I4U23_006549 [Adineta vaga]
MNPTGSTVKFAPVSAEVSEYIRVMNKIVTIKIKFHCICAMKEYVHKSMDELRLEDYLSNRKFPSFNSIYHSNNATLFPRTIPIVPTTTGSTVNNNNNIIGAVANPFNIPTTSNNIFNRTVTTLPWTQNANPTPTVTTQPLFKFPTTTNIPTTVNSVIPPASNINFFPQWPPTTSPATNIPASSASNTNVIVPTPVVTIAGTTLIPNIFQPSLNLNRTNLMTTTTTTSASIINPTSVFQNVSTTQTQPIVTSSSAVINRQQFLTASLLDPYGNRGRKDFTNMSSISLPKESTTESALSTAIPAPIPVVLPIQSNFQKTPVSHSSIDLNFKLKPVSSSPNVHENIQPTTDQQLVASIESKKSTLSGDFTDEEEIVLLGRTKLSKLRISNDSINQSNTLRSSLYPVRNLAELEKLTTSSPVSFPISTTSINTESTSSNPTVVMKKSESSVNPTTFHLPILTREDYYMKPNQTELNTLFNDKGQCIVKQFTVGHDKYGSVTFYGQINVSGLNLDEIIQINHHEVIVYPDDTNKPSVGEELNRPARITLFHVYPIDRSTRVEITDMERIKAMNYTDYLRNITRKFNGEFVNYDSDNGSWTFMVKHFTRYGLDDN